MTILKSYLLSISCFTLISLLASCQAQNALEIAESQQKIINSNIIYDHHHQHYNHHIDAPKYYDLNALLYKNKQTGDKTSSSASDDASGVSDLRPINGARINPRDGSVENEASNPGGESSIDSLIRAMRRSMAEQDRKQLDRDSRPDSMSSVDESDDGSSYESGKRGPNTGAVGSGGRKSAVDIGSDDEASIQRKSTNIDDDSSGVSSRLRGNGKSNCLTLSTY